MRTRLPALVLPLALALALAACGGDDAAPDGAATDDPGPGKFDTHFGDAEAYPVFASSEIVVGRNRILVGILNREDAPIGSPKLDVAIRFFDLAESEDEPAFATDLDYLEIVPGARGLYVGYAEFHHSGRWGAEVEITGDGIDETVHTALDVREEGTTPAVGAKAPRSDTPTIKDAPLKEITTDTKPDPDFYKLSVADAVTSGRPAVIVFATPRFCTSQVCGPTLDIVKQVAKDFRNIHFVHVEVYTNLDNPSNLKYVPAVEQWRLPSEPWVFVVDERGRIAAKYEGSLGVSELERFLRRL